MEEQKKGFLAWVKKHRKKLIIAGISATALIGIILCMKNRDSIEALWKSLIGAIEKSPYSSFSYNGISSSSLVHIIR